MRIAKTLIIGIGTSGQNVCEGVAKNLNSKYGDYKKASWVGIKVLETAHKSEILEKGDFVSMSVDTKAFSDYISGASHVGSNFDWGKWGDPNLLKNVGSCINVGAGNIRMAGRLALFHNYALISGKITSEIRTLQELTPAKIQDNLGTKDNIDVMSGPVNVYVVGSLCGGTGSGCCADLGYLVRVWGSNDVAVTGIFTLPHWSLQAPRLKKNAFVALTELNHYMLNDSTWSQKLPGFSNPASDGRKPYDVIYLTQPPNGQPNEITKNESTISSFLTAVCTETSHDVAAANVDGMNALATNRQLGYLSPSFSSFGIAVLEYPAEHISRMCKERMLQKIYSSWQDNLGKDITQGRNDLLEEAPKPIIEKLFDKNIIDKYEARMKEEFARQVFPKDSSIHNKMDVIFSTINREIHDDIDIKTKADAWIDNFLKNIEDRFLMISQKYLTSLTAGPGLLARILKKTKEDIDAWSMPKGDIDKAYSKAKLNVDTARKNIKKQAEDYINIKGLFFLIGAKQKEAWEDVLKRSIAYVKDMIFFVAAEKVKTFVDAMVYGNNTIQDKYNLFSDKYITRLENFESAIVAMGKYHEKEYNDNIEKVPSVKGKQFYKNHIVSDEVEEIYNMVIKDSSNNPNISVEKREFDMASSVIDKLKQDLVPKLTGTISSFDSRIMSDIKEYIPDDIKKTIELGANNFFSDLSKYRHIIYLINKEGDISVEISSIQQGSEPTMKANEAPIPVKFQKDPDIGNINVNKSQYAFCSQQESRLFKKEYIDEAIRSLSNVQLKKPVFDSKDPYRIMALQMEHGSSLAHINGILKSNDSDMQALEDSNSCNDFTNWNTRMDVKWKNCLISKETIDKIKQFWVVFRFIGNYRDANGNYLICDRDGKISPWYKISQGRVFLDIVSDNVVVKTEKVELSIDDAIMDIASTPSRQRAIEMTCQNRIKTYIDQVGKIKFIEILFKCLESFSSYYMNISKEQAENAIIGYCFANGLESEYINFKFPVDRPVNPDLFSHLYRLDGSEGQGYYCPNGHKLGTNDVQETLRGMIQNRFRCPHCDSEKRYWPYLK